MICRLIIISITICRKNQEDEERERGEREREREDSSCLWCWDSLNALTEKKDATDKNEERYTRPSFFIINVAGNQTKQTDKNVETKEKAVQLKIDKVIWRRGGNMSCSLTLGIKGRDIERKLFPSSSVLEENSSFLVREMDPIKDGFIELFLCAVFVISTFCFYLVVGHRSKYSCRRTILVDKMRRNFLENSIEITPKTTAIDKHLQVKSESMCVASFSVLLE